MMLLLLSALALAKTTTPKCELRGKEAVAVSATMGTVTVGGHTYLVRGRFARTEFQNKLSACGYAEALDHFVRWRANRRAVNAGAIVGGAVFLPVLLIVPLNAAVAGSQKDAMVAALSEGK